MKLVETFNDLFQELFTITLSHRGFDSLNESMICDHIKIKPDKDTEKIMKDHRIGYRFNDDNFVCYIQCELENPPAASPRVAYVVPAPGIKFRFLLKASNYFMDTTVIKSVAKGTAYYFNNQSNAGTGMFISHDPGEVNDNDLVIVSKVDIRETYLGVIDIFSSGAVNPTYELFSNAAGRLRKPKYQLLFRSSI